MPPNVQKDVLINKSERDHVRLRTGTYLGGTGTTALVHTIHELIDNVADEWLAGGATTCWVTIGRDQRVTVRDDGRGIPLDDVVIASSGRVVPGPQAAFTEMRTGSKFSEGATSGGLNGMGLKAVTFMAREVNVEIHRDGIVYTQTFKNGRKGTPSDVLTIEPPVRKRCPKDDHGTTVRFLYDDSVFDKDAHVDGERILRKIIHTARLCPGLTFHFSDERTGITETIVSRAGLIDFISELNTDETPVFASIVRVALTREVRDANGEPTTIWLEAAFQPAATETTEERGFAFTNLIHNPDGGTHLAGFRKGLTRALNAQFRKAGLLKDAGFENADVMAGLAFVVSIRMASPNYESQTKKKLTSAWIEPVVADMIADATTDWLVEHPAELKAWYGYLAEVRRAREALAVERRAVKAKVGQGNLDPLLSKIARETVRDPSRAEIYFVEGDSAGGNARQARDRTTQAILPFRGKLLNLEAADRKRAIENEDVRRIASALETGVGQHFDYAKLRYSKIILLADADEDGGHIQMLWLAALHRMFPELLQRGHVYVAVPPLYSVYDYRAKRRFYFYSLDEFTRWAKGRPADSYAVTRFKGLGEMSAADLRETAMNPATRRIRRITVPDIGELKTLMADLMGRGNAEKRRAWMDEHARGRTTREDVAVTAA